MLIKYYFQKTFVTDDREEGKFWSLKVAVDRGR